MEELAQLRQLLVAGNTLEAIAFVDELEEMSKKAINFIYIFYYYY
ncbi:MAG: hypothetical protein QNJ70_30160 [Xenococcaceae cyanobacterium MO_207.B15]|nr:hypothetical protein [Xenococcaceae cyanobacterium MO_207.B15]